MLAEISIPAEIGRNDRNSPKWVEIFSEMEQGGFSFRFTHRYEIFRPFHPTLDGNNHFDTRLKG
jgi:hypothetical protein